MEGVERHDSLLVRKIENGTVIDHVTAWRAELILKVLRLDRLMKGGSNISVATLQNVTSTKLGRKDVIKVDNWYLDESVANILCLIEPNATINYIKDWKVEKYTPAVPDSIEGRLRCPELRCITNAEREPVLAKFLTLKRGRTLQCHYCDTLLDFDRIPEFVKA